MVRARASICSDSAGPTGQEVRLDLSASRPFSPGKMGAPSLYREPIGSPVVPSASRFLDRDAPIPANGKKCDFTGLGHGRLYQLLNGPARAFVRVASLRAPGAKRGSRLFHVGDLLNYLDRLAAEQAAGSVDPNPPSADSKKS